MDTPSSSSRRAFLQTASGVSAALAMAVAAGGGQSEEPQPADIPALLPRGGRGHQFVFYSDCCSGVAGAGNEQAHAAVNRVVSRIRPRPEFIAFPGDAVAGYCDSETLRRQWDHWWNTEMAWFRSWNLPLFQSTSNHNTYDLTSEEVFRQVHPHVPQNGPDEFRGLAYAVRRDDLLYVSTHQPDRTRPYRHAMTIDTMWLDQMLASHADARFKFVCGHYPVFPVNGYIQWPQWCFRPEEREPFWKVLVKHKVNAYLCSHILAFDVQIHEGIPQILSGGAGTQGTGPLTMMPSRSEYLHCVQVAVDEQGLCCRTRDVTGAIRESFAWPCSLPSVAHAKPLAPADCSAQMAPLKTAGKITAWHFRTDVLRSSSDGQPQTLLWGWDGMEGLATVWIGFEGTPRRLTVRLIPQSGFGWQLWSGPSVSLGKPWEGQVALHAGLGPGGVLWRSHDDAAWQSLETTSTKGIEELTWPRGWTIGHGPSGLSEWPCQARNLEVRWTQADLPEVG